jgi:hypothetical protein
MNTPITSPDDQPASPPVNDTAAVDNVEAVSVTEPTPLAYGELPPESDDVESVAPAFHKERVALEPNPNSELSKPATTALDDKLKAKHASDDPLGLVTITLGELNALIEEFPNLDIGQGDQGKEWTAIVNEASQYLQRGNALLSSLTRDQSMWRQSMTFGAEQLAAGRPRFGDNVEPGNRLTGEKAMLKLTASLGLGAIIQVPLWHSGIWLSMKAPAESDLLQLDRRMAMEKISLGRFTNGLIFSNNSIYMNSYLANFALSCVYDATVKDISLDALKSIIKINDLPTLIWALACTIWPNGYKYKHACANDPAECTHVTEAVLNLTKLSWTDDRVLTDNQRRHMANRNAKVTVEQLDRYQEEHAFNNVNRVFDVSEGAVSVELRVPTLAEYELSGFEWVDGIVDQADKAFGVSLTGQQRNDYIMDQGKLTSLRQYTHWVERMVTNNDGGVIEDRKTLENAISVFSSSDEIQDEFFTAVGKYIDTTTMSLIAIPKYDCPRCGKPVTKEATLHPYLIPLDVARVFFTLLDHRISKGTSRSAV